VVDTLGFVLEVVVTPADVPDRDIGWWLLEQMAGRYLRLERIWADSSYAGALEGIAATHYGRVLEIVKAAAQTVGFAVQPYRWIVERTLAWLGRYRQLSKEYTEHPESSEALIYLAMIHRMLDRLCLN